MLDPAAAAAAAAAAVYRAVVLDAINQTALEMSGVFISSASTPHT